MNTKHATLILSLAVFAAAVPLSVSAANDREPTEQEMRRAIDYAIQGDNAEACFANPVAGLCVKITHFRKIACAPARGRAGYFCDYEIAQDATYYENTRQGMKRSEGMDALMTMMKAFVPDVGAPVATSGRFVYSTEHKRWMRLSN